MSKLDGTGLYVGYDWPKRKKAQELVQADDPLTKELIRVFSRYEFSPDVLKRASEIATIFEKSLPPGEPRMAGRPSERTELQENYIWLAVERVAKEHARKTGKRNVRAALAEIYPLRPQKIKKNDKEYIEDGPLHAIDCAASARRIHSRTARRLKANERSWKYWTSLISPSRAG